MFGLVKILIYLTVVILVSGYGYLSLVKRDRVMALERRLPPMMLAILIVGYLTPTFWLLYALLFLLPLALSRTRMDACVIYIVALLGVSPVSQMLTAGGMYITPIDTIHVLALGLLFATFARPTAGRPLVGAKFDAPVLILIVLVILSQVRDQNLTTFLRTLQYELIWLAIPYYIISRSIRSAADMNRLMMAMVFGAFVLSVISVYEAIRSWPIYLNVDSRLGSVAGLSQTLKVRAGLMRAAASFPESTSFSMFLAMGLLAAMASRSAFRSNGRYLLVLGVIAIGLLLAQARGGWIAAAVGVLAYDFYLRNYGRLAGRVAIIGVGTALLFFAAASTPRLSEALGLTGAAVGTKDYRVELLRRGVEEIRRHPLTGTDMAAVTRNMQDMMQGEHIVDFVNGYVYFGVTTGIPGVIALFFVMASLALWMLVKRLPAGRSTPPDRTGAFVFAVTSFYIVTAGTSGFGGKPVSFLLVVMAIGSVHHLARKRTAGPARPSRPARGGAGPLPAAQPA